MKNPLAAVKSKFGEVKGRTLLLVIVVVVVFIIAAVFSFKENETSLGGISGKNPTSAVKAPNLPSTPGVGDVNDKAYIALQGKANAQKAEEAINTGSSAVATVTNDQFVHELSIPEPGMASIPGTTSARSAQAIASAQQKAELTPYEKAHQEQRQREQALELERVVEQQAKHNAANQEAYEGLMQAQLKGLMNQWKPPSQNYVHNAELGATTPVAPAPQGSPPIYKAGDIIFGVMETSVNSDEPGPVMVKVVSGPLAGAKLLGSFRRVEDQVFIEFTLLSADDIPNSIPIKAVAIDPETARTALATDVDYHRLLRYSTLFASAFLQGMGDAVLAGIQPDYSVENNDVLTVNSVAVGTRDQVIVGLGEVGRQAGEKFDKYFDIPPTVTVDSGTAVGLLFLQDFSLQPGPASPEASTPVLGTSTVTPSIYSAAVNTKNTVATTAAAQGAPQQK